MSKNYRPPKEEAFEVSTPERHAPRGDGKAKLVEQDINGTYRQPWVKEDGVTDPDGHAKIG